MKKIRIADWIFLIIALIAIIYSLYQPIPEKRINVSPTNTNVNMNNIIWVQELEDYKWEINPSYIIPTYNPEGYFIDTTQTIRWKE